MHHAVPSWPLRQLIQEALDELQVQVRELELGLQALREVSDPTPEQVHWARVLASSRMPQVMEAVARLRAGNTSLKGSS